MGGPLSAEQLLDRVLLLEKRIRGVAVEPSTKLETILSGVSGTLAMVRLESFNPLPSKLAQ